MKRIANFVTRESIEQELSILEEQVKDPDGFNSLFNQATRFILNRDYDGALDAIDKIIEIEPSSQMYVNRAICLYRLGEIVDSIDSCKKSLELDSENKDAATLLQKLTERLRSLADYTMQVYQ